MKHGLAQDSQEDHPALEGDEFALDTHQVAAPAAEQLGNTVRASGQDGNVGEEQGADEEAETGVGQQSDRGVGEDVPASVGTDGVFDNDGAEDDENCSGYALEMKSLRR